MGLILSAGPPILPCFGMLGLNRGLLQVRIVIVYRRRILDCVGIFNLKFLKYLGGKEADYLLLNLEEPLQINNSSPSLVFLFNQSHTVVGKFVTEIKLDQASAYKVIKFYYFSRSGKSVLIPYFSGSGVHYTTQVFH